MPYGFLFNVLASSFSLSGLGFLLRQLHHMELILSPMTSPLSLLASPPPTVSVVTTGAFLPVYRGPTFLLRSTPSNPILRAVTIAHRPFAPVRKERMFRGSVFWQLFRDRILDGHVYPGCIIVPIGDECSVSGRDVVDADDSSDDQKEKDESG